jgi:VanZ family protein
MKVKIFIKYWLPVILWCSLIFFLSCQPEFKTSWGFWDFVLRKIFHMLEFGTLTFLFYRALFPYKINIKKAIIFSATFAFLYAISDEIHQLYIPGREGTIRDILIDTMGIIIAIWIIRTYSLHS